MFELYNHLALYSIKLIGNGTYVWNFSLICIVLGFICFFIGFKLDNDFKDDFWKSFGWSLCGSVFSGMFGFVLSMVWSICIFYILPFIIISFLIFKSDKMISYIQTKLNSLQSKSNIVKSVIHDISCEELAKQAYENLKKDFPDIKYESVLKNIKNKM